MYKYLILEKEENLALLTLNHLPMNALCNEMVDELDEAITSLEQDEEVKTVIITGSGDKAFMAGADISELDKRDFILGRQQSKRRQEVFNKIFNMRVPTIAAVNGFALGAGLELTLSCTIRIASDKAKFGAPEVNLGITPGDGATQRLPRIIGLGRAMNMIIIGEMIKAEDALQYGLVTKVVPPEELLESAKETAKAIMKKAPLAVMFAKEAVNMSFDTALNIGLNIESYLHALCCSSEDKKEGVEAFLNKRAPQFKGK
jgi:enoyl-CoA hydratase